MLQDKSKRKKMLALVVAIIVVAFISYSLLFTGETDESALVMSPDANQSQTVRSLLVLFDELAALNLDPAVLSNPVFVSLRDFSREIPSEPVGRTNPFAPI